MDETDAKGKMLKANKKDIIFFEKKLSVAQSLTQEQHISLVSVVTSSSFFPLLFWSAL